MDSDAGLAPIRDQRAPSCRSAARVRSRHLAAQRRRQLVRRERLEEDALEAGLVRIRQTLTTADYRPTLAQPRMERSRRAVALDPDTVAALREHRTRQLEERLAAGNVWSNAANLVFTREDGSPIHPQAFSEAFERHVVAAGLPKIPLHGLRHTHAMIAFRWGFTRKSWPTGSGTTRPPSRSTRIRSRFRRCGRRRRRPSQR
jgi:integrase